MTDAELYREMYLTMARAAYRAIRWLVQALKAVPAL